MSLFHVPLNEITERHLQVLLENNVIEAKSIEYKLQLPSNETRSKKEFLADVSSFANASGGDIIFGIKEENGLPVDVCGISGINPDQEIRRLSDIIFHGISPRIIGYDIKPIFLQSGAVVIILRIPRSWSLPHMVVFQGENRFFTRDSNGRHSMDVTEIRNAILASEAIIDRIKNFRTVRLSMIIAEETPLITKGNPLVILHLIPMSAFDPTVKIDLNTVENKIQLLLPLFNRSDGSRYNAHGIMTFSEWGDGGIFSYTQVFRNGIIEAADALCLSWDKEYIPSLFFERRMIDALDRYIRFLEYIGINVPLFLSVSLMRVKGMYMAVNKFKYPFAPRHLIDCEDLLIPEEIIEDYSSRAESILRPILDQIWNATGWPSSIYYDKEGNWKGE